MDTNAEKTGVIELRYARPDAIRVFVVGSFNGWNPQADPMQSDGRGNWHCEIWLPAGVYPFHYLAEISPVCPSGSHGNRQWASSELHFAVTSPGGGTFEVGSPGAPEDAEPGLSVSSGGERFAEGLLPLSRLEGALIRGFRRLPDHESRSAFLDVLRESVYS